MKLKIWHTSDFTRQHFEREVPDVETAKQWLKLLAEYDLYLRDLVISNAQGLMIWNEDGGGWDEWEDETGDDISTVMAQEDKFSEECPTKKITKKSQKYARSQRLSRK